MPPRYRLEPDGLPLRKKGRVTLRPPQGASTAERQEPPQKGEGGAAFVAQVAVIDAQTGTKLVEIDHL